MRLYGLFAVLAIGFFWSAPSQAYTDFTIAQTNTISAGHAHMCFIDTGTVKCVGKNMYGVMGPSVPVNPQSYGNSAPGITYTTPVSVSLPGTVISMSSDNTGSCAVLSNGKAYCWGWYYNDNGNPTIQPTPAMIPNIAGARKVSTGFTAATNCLVMQNGTVSCRGWAEYTPTNITNAYETATSIPATVIDVDTGHGANASCALMATQQVACWGNGTGAGTTGSAQYTPYDQAVIVPGLSGVKKVITGGRTACALLVNKTVKCWGSNTTGGVGNPVNFGTGNPNPTPATVAGLSNVADIGTDTGGSGFCAIMENGTVKCWGQGRGVLTNNYATDYYNPVAVSAFPAVGGALTGTLSVSLGTSLVCATLKSTVVGQASNKVRCLGGGF